MKKTIALWTITLLVSISTGASAAVVAGRYTKPVGLTPVGHVTAFPQTAPATSPQAPAAATLPAGQVKPATWSSRDEYDAYTAVANEKTPSKLIPLADAF